MHGAPFRTCQSPPKGVAVFRELQHHNFAQDGRSQFFYMIVIENKGGVL